MIDCNVDVQCSDSKGQALKWLRYNKLVPIGIRINRSPNFATTTTYIIFIEHKLVKAVSLNILFLLRLQVEHRIERNRASKNPRSRTHRLFLTWIDGYQISSKKTLFPFAKMVARLRQERMESEFH